MTRPRPTTDAIPEAPNPYREAAIHRAMFRYRLCLAAHKGAEDRGEATEPHVEPVLRAFQKAIALGIDSDILLELADA